MDDFAGAVSLLVGQVEHSIKHGEFVISTGDFSHFWVDINELLTVQLLRAIPVILETVLDQYYQEHGPFTLVVPEFLNTVSENTFPLPLLVDTAQSRMENAKSVDQVRVQLVDETLRCEFSAHPGRRSVVLIGMSVHVRVLTRIIEGLRDHGCETIVVMAMICREFTSPAMLRLLGAPLLPLIFIAENGAVYSLANMIDATDPRIHEFGEAWEFFARLQ